MAVVTGPSLNPGTYPTRYPRRADTNRVVICAVGTRWVLVSMYAVRACLLREKQGCAFGFLVHSPATLSLYAMADVNSDAGGAGTERESLARAE